MRKNRRKTQEEFELDVFKVWEYEYTVLGDYKGVRNKVLVKHNKCGHEWEVLPNDFLRKHGCPKCFGTHKKTTEQFKKEVFEKYGNEYTVLGKYINSRTKILMRHEVCGTEWEITPGNFLHGYRCPECYGTKKLTQKDFEGRVAAMYGDDYTVLGIYVNNQTKILMHHNKCGNSWKITPSDFHNGYGCPYCAGNKKKTDKQFKKEVFDLLGDEYTFLDSYVNANTKLRVVHNICGTEYLVTPHNFLTDRRCPFCKSSKGENKVADFLIKNRIKFETEHMFEDLKDKKHLRFDFYLPEYNICIEYDGKQHFKPATFGGISKERAEENLKICQKRDKMKTEYCKENGITLIRIPYTEFDNIKKILKEELKCS